MILEGVIEEDGSGDVSIDDVTVRQGVCEQGTGMYRIIHMCPCLAKISTTI